MALALPQSAPCAQAALQQRPVSRVPAACAPRHRPFCAAGRCGTAALRPRRHQAVLCSATEEQVSVGAAPEPEQASAPAASEPAGGNFVPVCKPEDLPKGTRKEVRVGGVGVLLFWYRSQIYAIESRSPAEGAYSEGFLKAMLTQDYEIACPQTGTTFSLKTGEITAWYPSNPVLRLITPQETCRNLDVYPVKLTQDAILIDVEGAANTRFQARARDASMVEETDGSNIYTQLVTIFGVLCVAAAGVAIGSWATQGFRL